MKRDDCRSPERSKGPPVSQKRVRLGRELEALRLREPAAEILSAGEVEPIRRRLSRQAKSLRLAYARSGQALSAVKDLGFEKRQRMVGAIGFEPMTPCAQGRCATRLRYAPTDFSGGTRGLHRDYKRPTPPL